jgi:hypothetical protein
MNEPETPPPRDGSSERHRAPGDERQAAQRRRDAALRRITRVRAGVIVATVGLSAGFAGLVAEIAPGKTYHAPAASDGHGSGPTPAATRQPGLRPGRAPRSPGRVPEALAPVPSGGS